MTSFDSPHTHTHFSDLYDILTNKNLFYRLMTIFTLEINQNYNFILLNTCTCMKKCLFKACSMNNNTY